MLIGNFQHNFHGSLKMNFHIISCLSTFIVDFIENYVWLLPTLETAVLSWCPGWRACPPCSCPRPSPRSCSRTWRRWAACRTSGTSRTSRGRPWCRTQRCWRISRRSLPGATPLQWTWGGEFISINRWFKPQNLQEQLRLSCFGFNSMCCCEPLTRHINHRDVRLHLWWEHNEVTEVHRLTETPGLSSPLLLCQVSGRNCVGDQTLAGRRKSGDILQSVEPGLTCEDISYHYHLTFYIELHTSPAVIC